MKDNRQRAIIKLINEKEIETQSELVNELHKRGFLVTQATVSRDIKELGFIKLPANEKAYRYAVPRVQQSGNVFKRLERLFKDSVSSLNYSENLVLIRTLPGAAQAVASCIDNLGWKEIIGTVAGDDTIIVIIKPKRLAKKVLDRFTALT